MKKFRKIGRITHQQFFSYHTVGSENQIYLSFDMPLCEHAEQRVSVMVYIKSYLHFQKYLLATYWVYAVRYGLEGAVHYNEPFF